MDVSLKSHSETGIRADRQQQEQQHQPRRRTGPGDNNRHTMRRAGSHLGSGDRFTQITLPINLLLERLRSLDPATHASKMHTSASDLFGLQQQLREDLVLQLRSRPLPELPGPDRQGPVPEEVQSIGGADGIWREGREGSCQMRWFWHRGAVTIRNS